MTDMIPRERTEPGQARLPQPLTDTGEPRRIGVEIEFGGLTEPDVAGIVADELGGKAEAVGPREWRVSGGRLGPVGVEFDTVFRDAEGALADFGLDIARGVVPVEIVTAPVLEDDLPALEALCARLRAAGAIGSRQGVFLGFGVHFNPQIAGPDAARIAAVLTAYALLEDWLRLRFPIDAMRRVLPFVDRYPADLLDALTAPHRPDWTIERLTRTYLTHIRSRNHGLDLLPLLAHLDRDAVVARLGEAGAKGARPTYHFRLPDCRIDEPDWRLGLGWQMWVAVERTAARPELLDRLSALWRARRERVLPPLEGWGPAVDAVMAGAGAEVLP